MTARYFGGFATLALIAAAAPAASAQVQTTGRNVTAVMVDAGPNAQYVKQGRDVWAELDTRGRPVFQFRESRRDDWSVYLVDEARGIEIQLDIHRRKVSIMERGGPRRDLYNIVRFTHTGQQYPSIDARPPVVATPPVGNRRPIERNNDWRGVNGNNVTFVRVDGGTTFEDAGRRRWNQYEPNGRLWSQLEEVRRDADRVFLNDRGRGIEIVIDLQTTEVRGTAPGDNRWRRYYGIVVAEDRGGRGNDRDDRDDRDDRGGRDVRDRDARDRDDKRPVEVGPIWNQRDAETKCADKARDLRGEWTGGWWTTQPGRMSVCEIRTGGRGGDRGGWGGQRDVLRNIEVGPIWSQNDAVAKCNAKGRELRAEWTGQWRTTQTGRMSECEFRFR